MGVEPDRRALADQPVSLRRVLRRVDHYSQHAGQVQLRAYQRRVAQAVIDSVMNRKGLSFVVMFPRQSGKNELQAHLESYLLTLFGLADPPEQAEIVKLAPTWKPQAQNGMRRLERVLEKNQMVHQQWLKEQGYIYRVGQARIYFLSAHPTANIVGATAATLLSIDEAQEVPPEKYDKEIAPMAASTNATRIFWGTAWTSQTLLGRELRAAQSAQDQDGVQRVFRLAADEVAQLVPAYGQFVSGQVTRLGRDHPLVRTQFFSEEIDADAGLFTRQRQALMQGEHPACDTPQVGAVYAVLIDVAGQDERGGGLSASSDLETAPGGSRRDSSVASVVQIDLDCLADPLVGLPGYRLVQRYEWVGLAQTALYDRLKNLVTQWRAAAVVVDATGIGAGVSSFLQRAFGRRVIPFIFTQASKSKLGWDFITAIESGRYHEPRLTSADDSGQVRLQQRFWQQATHCEFEAAPGGGGVLRWGVPDGKRAANSGEVLHDDLLISAALCVRLDDFPFQVGSPPTMLRPTDVLRGIDREKF